MILLVLPILLILVTILIIKIVKPAPADPKKPDPPKPDPKKPDPKKPDPPKPDPKKPDPKKPDPPKPDPPKPDPKKPDPVPKKPDPKKPDPCGQTRGPDIEPCPESMMLEGQRCAYRSLKIDNKTCYVYQQSDCLPGYSAEPVSISGTYQTPLGPFEGGVYDAQQCVKDEPGVGLDKDTKPPSTWDKIHVYLASSDHVNVIGTVPSDAKGKKIYISNDIYPIGGYQSACSKLQSMYGYYTISGTDTTLVPGRIELEQVGFYNGTVFPKEGDGGCHAYAYVEN